MADPFDTPGYRFAVNEFPGDGVTTEWNIDFAGRSPGYISIDHVRAALIDEAGVETPVLLGQENFILPTRIRLSPVGTTVPVGTTLRVWRDTPKNEPVLDYTDGALMIEKNLDTSNEQSIYSVAEMVDRFADSLDSIQDFSQVVLDRLADVETTANEAAGDAADAVAAAASATTVAQGAVSLAQGAVEQAEQASTDAAQAAADAEDAAAAASSAAAAAESASQDAADAADVAGGALAVAGAASAVASAADTKASQALTAAADAAQAAAQAQSDASQAASDANAAAASANTASDAASAAEAQATAAISAANAAQDTADGAVTTANNALSVASGIAGTAQDALDAAEAATTTANGIAGTAQDALDAANEATDTANTALTQASSAVATANGIAGTANDALDAATAALTLAENADSYRGLLPTGEHNLDNYQFPDSHGLWLQTTSSAGTVARNYPVAGGGALWVRPHVSGSSVTTVQVYRPDAPYNDVYVRVRTASTGSWGSWVKAVTQSDLDTFKSDFETEFGDSIIQYTQSTYVPLSSRGIASGVAALDTNARVPASQLPNATTSARGTVVLATLAQALAGTDTIRAVTPSSLPRAVRDKFVGTVSQDGGTPTGAAMSTQTITSGNVRAVVTRFADGRQVITAVWGAFSVPGNSENGVAYNYTFPEAFARVDWGSAQIVIGFSRQYQATMEGLNNTTMSGFVFGTNPSSVDGTLVLRAEGRWYV